MDSRTTRSQSRYRKSPNRLSPEILLFIFLNLTAEEIIIFRRVCKKWLDVIDTNKSLWRNLEWIGKSAESFKKAVEMFDQKSSSSLEMVSIKEGANFLNSKGLQQVVPVISRSRANLKSLSVPSFWPSLIIGQLLELARSSPNLEKLVLWDAQKESLPLARLVSSSKRFNGDSSASHLKVLWLLSSSSGDIKQFLQLPINSLISFGRFSFCRFQEIRPLLAKFSETIVHLRLSIKHGGSQMEQPLFCPNLKILEGIFQQGLQFCFDCSKLTHLVLSFETRTTRLQGFPSSVEQLWLKSSGLSVPVKVWEPLLRSCPNIKVLRLERFENIRDEKLRPEGLIQVLEKRQEMIDKGEEIQGLPVVPLQKLVLSLNRLSQIQLDRARKVAGEVIDIQDYPNFIELEYESTFSFLKI